MSQLRSGRPLELADNRSWPGAEWSTTNPEDAGLDRGKLAEAGRWQAESAGDREPYRILISRRGKIAAEWNFLVDPDAAMRQASASKSTYSTVLGIAIAEGVIKSADDRVAEYYPEMMDVPPGTGPKEGRHAFPVNEGITFRQLVGNTSGYMKPGEAPGKVFNYQTFGMNLLTHAVATAYNLYQTSDPERGGGIGTLTEWKVRDPIGGSWSWVWSNFTNLPADARLGVWGYNTAYVMTPHDMARCGLLWMRRGNWNGKQVVPEQWMIEVTRVNKDVLHNAPEEVHMYGLGFWCNDRGKAWPDLPRDCFAALGAGKQCVWVCPSLDLIVVQSPGTYPQSGNFESAEESSNRRQMQGLLSRIADAVVD